MRYQIAILITTAIFLQSCGVSTQIDEAKRFVKCEFRLQTIKDLEVAGVKIQNIKKISDLSIKKAAKITSALADKTMPLTFTLNVEAKNPNSETAALNELEWILLIDDREIVNGKITERIEIPGNRVTVFPVNINADLKKVFAGETKETLFKLIFNLVGEGDEPTHITLKVKPTIVIAGIDIKYPGYISVQKEFTSEDGKQLRKDVLKKAGE